MSDDRQRVVDAAIAAGWPAVTPYAILDAVEPVIRADERRRIVESLRCGMRDERCPWEMAAEFVEGAA